MFFLERERQLVDRGLHIHLLDDGLHGHVAKHAELLAHLGRERVIAAADEEVRLDADLTQLRDGLLRRLRLQFARSLQVRDERDVDESTILRADLKCELAHCLEKRQALDVASRAADLGDEHVDAFTALVDAVFDFVGDVRDHLHGLAEVIAPAFARDDSLINLARRQAVGL